MEVNMNAPTPDEVQHNVAEVLYLLGVGYEMEGLYEEAAESFRRALKRDPMLFAARHHLEHLQETYSAGLI